MTINFEAAGKIARKMSGHRIKVPLSELLRAQGIQPHEQGLFVAAASVARTASRAGHFGRGHLGEGWSLVTPQPVALSRTSGALAVEARTCGGSAWGRPCGRPAVTAGR